jgi:hypothetical protein
MPVACSEYPSLDWPAILHEACWPYTVSTLLLLGSVAQVPALPRRGLERRLLRAGGTGSPAQLWCYSVAAWTSGILHMTLIQAPRILARLITLTSVPRGIVRVIIMAVLVSSVSEAAAQQPSQDFSRGNDLFRGCKVLSEGGTADAQLQSAGMFCAGFAFGLASVGRYLSVPGLRSCAPATLTAPQLASVIVKYVEAHPERMSEDARQATLEAFHDAWPCSN